MTKKMNPLGWVSLALVWALTAGHASANGIPCAKEGQPCAQNGGTVHATQYGKDTLFAMFTQNVSPLTCSHIAFGGDPKFGDHKSCKWSEVEKFPSYTWTKCADGDKGQRCKVSVKPGEVLMVRYGSPQGKRWLYSYVAEDFDCRLNGFGFDVDVAPGVWKQCERASKPEPYVGTWKTCASGENEICKFTDKGPRLVRYGDTASKRFWYKTIIGEKMTCGLGTFRWDPAPGVYKACQYLEVPFAQRLAKVQGNWEKILSCVGCSSTEYSVTTGVTTGKETVKTAEWGSELTASLETTAGGGAGGVIKSEVTVGFSATVSNSFASSVGSSFTKEEASGKTVTCEKGALYHFVTSVDEFCGAGVCTTTANSGEYVCQVPTAPAPTGSPTGST